MTDDAATRRPVRRGSRRALGRSPPRLRVLRIAALVAGIAIPVGILLPRVSCGCETDTESARDQISSFAEGIALFVRERHVLPENLEALTAPSPESGEPYFGKIPLDPWSRAYAYQPIEAAPGRFEIRSAGEDRRWNTDDDLVHTAGSGPVAEALP